MILYTLLALLLIIVLVAIFLFNSSFVLISENEVAALEYLGKFEKLLTTGVHFKYPLVHVLKTCVWTQSIEEPDGRVVTKTKHLTKLPKNEVIFDIPNLAVITKDKIRVSVNRILFYRIKDHIKAFYQIDDLLQALQQLANTYLRDAISQLTVEEAVREKQKIQHLVFKSFSDMSEKWGIEITKFDIQDIELPRTFVDAQTKLIVSKTQAEADILKAKTDEEIKLAKVEANLREKEMIAKSNFENQKRDIEISRMKADAEAYSANKVTESKADSVVKLAEAEMKHTRLMKEAGFGNEYFLQKEFTKAWTALATSEGTKMVVIPYESAKFFGASSLSHLQNQS